MTDLYILLGTPDSGRREIAVQLLDGLPGETFVYIAENEPPSAAEDALTAIPGVESLTWKTDGANVDIPDAEHAPERVIFIAEGARNPVDQLEILSLLAPRLGWKVRRIITTVDCRLAKKAGPALADYHKACGHFSDVMILNRRENLPPSFDRDFKKPFEDERMPVLFESAKKGRIANPDLLLLHETRRLSLAFDDDRDVFDEMEFDAENLPDEPFDIRLKTDPYFERDERGERRIRIPDIREHLAPAS